MDYRPVITSQQAAEILKQGRDTTDKAAQGDGRYTARTLELDGAALAGIFGMDTRDSNRLTDIVRVLGQAQVIPAGHYYGMLVFKTGMLEAIRDGHDLVLTNHMVRAIDENGTVVSGNRVRWESKQLCRQLGIEPAAGAQTLNALLPQLKASVSGDALEFDRTHLHALGKGKQMELVPSSKMEAVMAAGA